jgi:hypothetical protein
MSGSAICAVCKKVREFKTETIPVYKDEAGKCFICAECIKEEYKNGKYYKRVSL